MELKGRGIMSKKRLLVKDTDPVIYRITGYLPLVVLVIGWLFFLYDKRKVNEYLRDQFLSWEKVIIYMMHILQVVGIALTLFFILMVILKSRKMLYVSPIPFCLLIITLLTLPGLLRAAVIYSFSLSGANVILMLLFMIAPILLIHLYLKMSNIIWILLAALTGSIIIFLPFFLSNTLSYSIAGYRPYQNLLAANCMFYFSLLISFLVLKKYIETVRKNEID